MPARTATFTSALQVSVRAAASAGLAVAIAQFLKLQYPIYAVLAAVIVIDLSPSKTLQLALQRLAGTVVGATVGAMLSYVLPAGPVAVVLSIFAAMLLTYLARMPAAAKWPDTSVASSFSHTVRVHGRTRCTERLRHFSASRWRCSSASSLK